MGEAVNIRDLAERMIRLSGRTVGTEIPIRINGPRPGEKLVEELRAPTERAEPTAHPSIVHLHTVALPYTELEAGIAEMTDLAHRRRSTELSGVLFDLVASAQGDGEEAVDLNAVDLNEVERSESWSRSTS
jgi:FlaA1/EpsC-like NDP-sugar epimerase